MDFPIYKLGRFLTQSGGLPKDIQNRKKKGYVSGYTIIGVCFKDVNRSGKWKYNVKGKIFL